MLAGWPRPAGGLPWQEVQFTVALAFQAMVAAVAPESAALPPWHQVAEQESVGPATDVVGTEPLVEASVPQATATVPLAWVVSFAAGIGPWHSVQARPAERKRRRQVAQVRADAARGRERRYRRRRPRVALKPGAEVALVLATAAPAWPESTPWQAVQPLAGFWIVPSTWVAAVTVVAVVPVWQAAAGRVGRVVRRDRRRRCRGRRCSRACPRSTRRWRSRSGCRPGSCRGSRCSSRCARVRLYAVGTAPWATARLA